MIDLDNLYSKPITKFLNTFQIKVGIGFIYINCKRVKRIKQQLRYREKMFVTDSVKMSGTDFAKCPRCDGIMGKDFQSYCDRCGQALSWIYY